MTTEETKFLLKAKAEQQELIDSLELELTALRTKLAEREGFKLVPIKPSKHMLTIAHQHFEDMALSINVEQIEIIYKAMLAAAPQPNEKG